MNTAQKLLASFLNGSAFQKEEAKILLLDENGDVVEDAEKTKAIEKELVAEYLTEEYQKENIKEKAKEEIEKGFLNITMGI